MTLTVTLINPFQLTRSINKLRQEEEEDHLHKLRVSKSISYKTRASRRRLEGHEGSRDKHDKPSFMDKMIGMQDSKFGGFKFKCDIPLSDGKITDEEAEEFTEKLFWQGGYEVDCLYRKMGLDLQEELHAPLSLNKRVQAPRAGSRELLFHVHFLPMEQRIRLLKNCVETMVSSGVAEEVKEKDEKDELMKKRSLLEQVEVELVKNLLDEFFNESLQKENLKRHANFEVLLFCLTQRIAAEGKAASIKQMNIGRGKSDHDPLSLLLSSDTNGAGIGKMKIKTSLVQRKRAVVQSGGWIESMTDALEESEYATSLDTQLSQLCGAAAHKVRSITSLKAEVYDAQCVALGVVTAFNQWVDSGAGHTSGNGSGSGRGSGSGSGNYRSLIGSFHERRPQPDKVEIDRMTESVSLMKKEIQRIQEESTRDLDEAKGLNKLIMN